VVEQVVAETLGRRRAEGWLVGGTVRDRELGCFSPDLDIVVRDDPEAVAQELAARLRSSWFPLSARHGAYRVMAAEGHVDVAAMRGCAIEDDLARRDFTVNAMAVSLAGGELVDPFRGCDHLRAGLLAAVSDHIFRDDPLRLMRAVRFSHTLNMRFDPALERLLRAEAPLVMRAAGERITTELVLTLAHGPAAAALRLWDDLGLLASVLPEVGHPADLGSFERLDRLLAAPHVILPPRRREALAHRLDLPVDGDFPRAVALRLAMLCRRLDPEQAVAAGRRLKLSASMLSLLRTATVCFSSGLCSGGGLWVAAESRRAAVALLWALKPWEPEVLLLAEAALGAGDPCTSADDEALRDPFLVLLNAWADRAALGVVPPPVDGKHLMDELDLPPGPALGCVIREVRLAWEAGEATSVEALLDVARAAREAL
jgi:poly(A) polymerase